MANNPAKSLTPPSVQLLWKIPSKSLIWIKGRPGLHRLVRFYTDRNGKMAEVMNYSGNLTDVKASRVTKAMV